MGQSLPVPSAHYPLSTQEINVGAPFFSPHYTKIHSWDVSGNARHGVIKIDTQTLASNFVVGTEIGQTGTYSYKLRQGSFPNNATCVEKTSQTYNAFLEIPDPFLGYNPSDGFTISFWYKDTGQSSDYLLFNPYIRIAKEGTNLFAYFKSGGVFSEITGPPIDTNLWYFVALTFNQPGNSNKFRIHYYVHENIGYNYAESTLTDVTPSGTFTNLSGDLVLSQIMSGTFDGALYDVRFYNQALTKTQVNQVRNQGWDWSRKAYAADQHINKGVSAYYPLNGNANDVQRGSGANGTATGVSYTTGKIGQAAQFTGANARIQIPSGTNFFSGYDVKKGFTISFWTNIDGLLNTANCADKCPAPITTSTNYQIFYANNTSNQTLFGMNRVLDWLGVNRYSRSGRNLAESGTGTLIPWNLWQYDPVSFNGQTGWYHVTLVYHPYYTRIYLSKPNSCELQCAYNYFGPQDLSAATQWGLGNPNGLAIKYLDEFRVYNWPMMDEEAAALHKIEANCSSVTVRSEDEEKVYEPVAVQPAITACPNPTSGDLVVRLSNMSEGTAQMRLFDLSGKLVYQRKEALKKGTRDVSLGNLKDKGISAGIYFLQVVSPPRNSTVKVVIQ